MLLGHAASLNKAEDAPSASACPVSVYDKRIRAHKQLRPVRHSGLTRPFQYSAESPPQKNDARPTFSAAAAASAKSYRSHTPHAPVAAVELRPGGTLARLEKSQWLVFGSEESVSNVPRVRKHPISLERRAEPPSAAPLVLERADDSLGFSPNPDVSAQCRALLFEGGGSARQVRLFTD